MEPAAPETRTRMVVLVDMVCKSVIAERYKAECDPPAVLWMFIYAVLVLNTIPSNSHFI